MQSLFNITSIEPDYSNKKIIIVTTFAVEKKTVNRKNIELIDASSGTAAIYKLSVDDDKIIITLKDWPSLDHGYLVKVTNIKDKLNRDLVSPINKEIMFYSNTKLKVKIVSPNNNEALIRQHNLINFSIKQINSDGSETEKPMPPVTVPNPSLPNEDDSECKEAMTEDELNVMYHFEFASDIAFFDIVKDYKTPYTEGYVQLDNGQYYMRCRVVENDMNGDWSETITFAVIPDMQNEEDNSLSKEKQDYINDMLAPIDFFLDEDDAIFEIVSHSNNGVTYPEFYIEFNKDIDINKLPDSIIAYRRDL